MSTESTLQQMERTRVVAIVRTGDTQGAVETGLAIAEGGLPVIEVSLTTPGAVQAISELAGAKNIVVGGGTVLTVDDVHRVADAGARFLVAPNMNLAVIEAAIARGLVVGPGVFTATECVQALQAGAHLLKLFPAIQAGIPAMRALSDPLPGVRWLPTGGISSAALLEWLAAGATAVGLGSELSGHGPDEARVRAQRVVNIVESSDTQQNTEGASS